MVIFHGYVKLPEGNLLPQGPLFFPHVKLGLDGEAYDLTKFAKVHPGGAKLITDAAGMDATAIFDPIHPKVPVTGRRW